MGMRLRLGWTGEMVMVILAVGRTAEGIVTSGPGRHRDGASELLSKRTKAFNDNGRNRQKSKNRGG